MPPSSACSQLHSCVRLVTKRRAPGTVVIEFRVEQEDSVYPMVPAGADLQDMIRRPSSMPDID